MLPCRTRTDISLFTPAPLIDHTLLRSDATRDDVLRLCEEAVEFGFAAVCIPPRFVASAASSLYGSDVRVATVIGFPCGYATSAVKLFEAGEAAACGAQELDVVIDLGAARSGDIDAVEEEVTRLVRIVPETAVKVIIECCLFEEPVKIALTEAVVRSGAAMVKTSTGFAAGGATLTDVALLAKVGAGRIGVKAAGGIRDWASCRAMLEAGATRIGTSAGRLIIESWRAGLGRSEQ